MMKMQKAKGRRQKSGCRTIAWISFCILTSAFCTGCNVFGAAAYKVMGPPAVPAEYVPEKEPMLVLVESYRRPGMAYDAEQLSRHVVEQLKYWETAPTIDLMELYKLRDADPQAFAKMTIPEVGRKLGARQVLYIDMVDSDLESSSGMQVYRGEMTVRIRVVDSQTSASRWPVDAAEGFPVTYETDFGGFASDGNSNTVRQKIYAGMAYQIVRNFRKWKPDNLQEEEMQSAGM
jgi:hypothetical protein